MTTSLIDWELLISKPLQHSFEIKAGVRVAKAEKSVLVVARLNPKPLNNGQSAAKARTEQGSTTRREP